MKIGLYFGSFNPIHIGHLIVADTLLQEMNADEIWFVISPQNPFKALTDLADEQHRLLMAQLSTQNHSKLKVSNIEFSLTKPSYTIHTLEVLQQQFLQHEFSIIMGSDNLVHLEQWKSYEKILEQTFVHVYARETIDEIPEIWLAHPKIKIHPLPLLNISSTAIRKKVKEGKSIRYWVRDEVAEYIEAHQLYL
jgi:nicotinate-nucleotide adenylyltransferase